MGDGGRIARTAGGGIWQSGGGLVSDGPRRIFFATGNGVSPPPGPGTQPARHLGRVGRPASGQLRRHAWSPRTSSARSTTPTSTTDDTDLGSGGPMALPDGFGTTVTPAPPRPGRQGRPGAPPRPRQPRRGRAGTGRHRRGAPGRSARTAGSGATLRSGAVTAATSTSFPNQGPLTAFSVGASAAGTPTLTRVARSAGTFGYTSGSPVVTSEGSTSGTALVWVVYSGGANGAEGQLRAYNALPSNGTMHAALRGSDRAGQQVLGARHRQAAASMSVTAPACSTGSVAPRRWRSRARPRTSARSPWGPPVRRPSPSTALRPVTVSGVSSSAPFTTGPVSLPRTLAAGETRDRPRDVHADHPRLHLRSPLVRDQRGNPGLRPARDGYQGRPDGHTLDPRLR